MSTNYQDIQILSPAPTGDGGALLLNDLKQLADDVAALKVNGGGGSGASGYSGFSGYSGATGLAGVDGASGYSGIPGASGYSGFSGLAGSIGSSGYSGFSGFSGVTGASGHSGYSGASITGASGYSGAKGTSGYSGISPTVPSNITTQGNTFNAANQLVQLDGTGALPKVPMAGFVETQTVSNETPSDTASFENMLSTDSFNLAHGNIIANSVSGSVTLNYSMGSGSFDNSNGFAPYQMEYGYIPVTVWLYLSSQALSNITFLQITATGSYQNDNGDTINVNLSQSQSYGGSMQIFNDGNGSDTLYMYLDGSGNAQVLYFPFTTTSTPNGWVTIEVSGTWSQNSSWTCPLQDDGTGTFITQTSDDGNFTLIHAANGSMPSNESSIRYDIGQVILYFSVAQASYEFWPIPTFSGLTLSYQWGGDTTGIPAGAILWDGTHFIGFNGSNLLQLDN